MGEQRKQAWMNDATTTTHDFLVAKGHFRVLMKEKTLDKRRESKNQYAVFILFILTDVQYRSLSPTMKILFCRSLQLFWLAGWLGVLCLHT